LSVSPDEEGLNGWLRLTLCPGVGPAGQRALLSAFGLPEQIFAASVPTLAKVIGAQHAAQLLAPPDNERIDAALQWCRQPGNRIITLADRDYPQELLNIADPPVLLYVKGDPALFAGAALAMVGARSATPQGISNAEAFARSLAETGFVIVSGLALGIDAAAHRGALSANGATIAVIGTGADRVYPAEHKRLAHEIAERGAIISEYPLGTAPRPHHFPRRNRLIAGLSRGVLVVEATTDSGSLITARLAAEHGRDVFAIPGSIHSPLSRGCHRLIREGAKLVETARDILEELPEKGRPAPQPKHLPSDDPSSASPAPESLPSSPPRETVINQKQEKEKERILAALGYDPTDLDTLATRSGLTLEALYAILLALELEGLICRLPGSRFQRL